MIGISNYDSNSIHTLFSGLSNGNRTSNSGLLGINIVDYSAIRTGSYFKLMKAYYGGNDSASKIVETNKKTSWSYPVKHRMHPSTLPQHLQFLLMS